MAVFDNFDLNNVLESFADIGGFNIVLPFLLIFAVTFAILEKILIPHIENLNMGLLQKRLKMQKPLPMTTP